MSSNEDDLVDILTDHRPIAKLSDRAFAKHENEAYCVKANHSTIFLCVEKWIWVFETRFYGNLFIFFDMSVLTV